MQKNQNIQDKNFSNEIIEHIYIHIPFCLRKCTYCSFFSISYSNDEKEKYLNILNSEIGLYKNLFVIKPKTIYFGGGTPSILSQKDILNILSKFDLSKCEEITLEANPIHITENYVEKIAETPINRISLGAQSFIENELQLLGRLHKVKQISEAVELLRKYNFNNLSLDLMYGLPYQKIEDVLFSLSKAIEIFPEHISLYCLSLEENVKLYKMKQFIPGDDYVAAMYEQISKILLLNKFERYEISNFARNDFISKHNLCYWNHKNYFGLGAGASGFINNMRYKNPDNISEYENNIKAGKMFPNREILSSQTLEKEFIFLQLRKTEGINLEKFKQRFGNDFLVKYQDKLEKLSDFLIVSEQNIRLKEKSFFISNEIFSEFV